MRSLRAFQSSSDRSRGFAVRMLSRKTAVAERVARGRATSLSTSRCASSCSRSISLLDAPACERQRIRALKHSGHLLNKRMNETNVDRCQIRRCYRGAGGCQTVVTARRSLGALLHAICLLLHPRHLLLHHHLLAVGALCETWVMASEGRDMRTGKELFISHASHAFLLRANSANSAQ